MSDIHKTYRLPNKTVASLRISTKTKLLEELGLTQDGSSQAFHTNNVLRRIIKYMAFRTGLTNKITIAQTDVNVPEIVTDTPYAAFLHYGKTTKGEDIHYTKGKHPKAGPRPDIALETAEGEAMAADLERYLKRKGSL